ncbi:MAG TPA: methyltransferase domain-containing protein [Gaiellaceae bacterium]|nr:methyltransferase domain-containing protein [Gaiellaceae bacterium]
MLSPVASRAPLGAEALRARLRERAPVWAFVDVPAAPFAVDDAVAVIPPDGARGPRVVDSGGLAVLAGPDDLRPSIGAVVEVLRSGRRWSLRRMPWRALLSRGDARTARAVDAAWRVLAPVAHVLAQMSLRASPAADDVESAVASFYADPDVLAGYDAATVGGLSEVEASVVARWMRPGDRVLDVGCGTGREAIALARRGLRVHGIDLCGPAIEAARRHARALDPDVDVTFERATLTTAAFAPASFDVVFVASDVYACTPGRSARVATLQRASAALRPGGVVTFQADVGRGRLLALAVDLPRAVGRALGIDAPAPGDRRIWTGPPPLDVRRHAFADDLEVIEELTLAGLTWEARVGSFVVARRPELVPQPGARATLAREIARVLRALPRVERARRALGPGPALAQLRSRAASAPCRDPAGRARLQNAIRHCDRLFPRGAGCYRRALLEVALDAGAAREPLHLGLDGREGHAWLDASAPGRLYPVTATL